VGNSANLTVIGFQKEKLKLILDNLISNAVKFTTTSSDSTLPKSGFSVAEICMLDDGRQNTSAPVRALVSSLMASCVVDT
jgi:signal transduction histidine kinase